MVEAEDSDAHVGQEEILDEPTLPIPIADPSLEEPDTFDRDADVDAWDEDRIREDFREIIPVSLELQLGGEEGHYDAAVAMRITEIPEEIKRKSDWRIIILDIHHEKC